jgi:hypothetical protein
LCSPPPLPPPPAPSPSSLPNKPNTHTTHPPTRVAPRGRPRHHPPLPPFCFRVFSHRPQRQTFPPFRTLDAPFMPPFSAPVPPQNSGVTPAPAPVSAFFFLYFIAPLFFPSACFFLFAAARTLAPFFLLSGGRRGAAQAERERERGREGAGERGCAKKLGPFHHHNSFRFSPVSLPRVPPNTHTPHARAPAPPPGARHAPRPRARGRQVRKGGGGRNAGVPAVGPRCTDVGGQPFFSCAHPPPFPSHSLPRPARLPRHVAVASVDVAEAAPSADDAPADEPKKRAPRAGGAGGGQRRRRTPSIKLEDISVGQQLDGKVVSVWRGNARCGGGGGGGGEN